MSGARTLVAVLVAGWLADALASTDRDVEAGIEAYEAGEHDEALARFDAAQERLGGQPEIHFDRGLALLANGEVESAREAFQHGTEAPGAEIRASSHYQLGNLSFDAEDWEGAIASYIECLKARPDHQHAKWNLELALQRKQDQEDQEDKDEDNQDDEQDKDENENDEDQGETGGETGGEDEDQDQEQGETGGQDEPEPDEEQGDTGGEDDQNQEQPDQNQDEGQKDQPKDQDPQQQPQPLDRVDIQKALDQLDAEDDFSLGKPLGRFPQPEKDW